MKHRSVHYEIDAAHALHAIARGPHAWPRDVRSTPEYSSFNPLKDFSYAY